MALLLVGGIIVLAGMLMGAGLAYQANALAKALVGFLQGFGPLGNFLAGLVGGPVVALTGWISHELGVAFQKVEDLGVRWISGLNQYVGYMAEYGLRWGEELLKTTVFLQTWLIPNLIRSALRTVEAEIVALYKHMPLPGHIVIRLPKISLAQVKAALAALLPGFLIHNLPFFGWLARQVHALGQTIAGTLPLHLPRTIRDIKARLRKLERATPVAIGVAAVALAFRKLRLGCLLGKNGKMIGSRLCRVDSSLLDALLAIGVGVVGVVSVRQLAREMLTLEGEAYDILHGLIKEVPDRQTITLRGATFPH